MLLIYLCGTFLVQLVPVSLRRGSLSYDDIMYFSSILSSTYKSRFVQFYKYDFEKYFFILEPLADKKGVFIFLFN